MKMKTLPLLPISVILFAATLPLQAANRYWDGTDTTANADGGNGTWNTGITPNWDTAAVAGANGTWANGDIAIFGGPAGTVSVSGGVATSGLTFDSSGYLVQNGTLTFSTNSTITTNADGTISSSLAFSGGSYVLTTGTGKLTLSGTANLGQFYVLSNVDITGSFNTNNKLIVNSTLNWSGTGSVGGSADYVGIGDNTSGTLNVTNGSLTVNPNGSFFVGSGTSASVNVSGGTLTMGNNRDIYIGAGYNGSVGGTGSVTVSGTGIFTTGTTSGALRLGAQGGGTGTINLNNGGIFATARTLSKGTSGTSTATAAINFNGGTLRANGNNGDWIWKNITANVQAGGAIIDSNGFNVSILQAFTNSGGTDGGLTKVGAGELSLIDVASTSSTFNGGVTVKGGALLVAGDRSFGAVPGTFTASNITLDGGAIKNTNVNLTLGSNRGIYLGNGGGSVAVWGGRVFTVPGAISGPGSLTKVDVGTLVLNGTSSYTGTTTVSNGALIVNGSISTSLLTTVASGASLTGTGTVGATTISSGGFISSGNNGAGNLTVSGNMVMSGTYVWDLAALSTSNPGTDFDIITVPLGDVDVTGATLGLALGSLTPSAIPFWQTNQVWESIINNTGSGLLIGNFAAIDNSAWSSLGGFSTVVDGNDVDLVWTAVPETNFISIIGCLGILSLFRRRCG